MGRQWGAERGNAQRADAQRVIVLRAVVLRIAEIVAIIFCVLASTLHASEKWVALDVDSTLSSTVKSQIQHLVSVARESKKGAAQLLPEVRSFVPALKQLALQKRFDRLESVLIRYDEPHLIVKTPSEERLILSREQSFSPIVAFRQEAVSHLPELALEVPVIQTGEQLPVLARWAVSLPSDFWRRYTVSWRGPHVIALFPKTFPQRYFLVTVEQQINDRLHALIDWVCTRRLPQDATQNVWCIDMRFRGRLILVKEGERGR